LPAVLLVYYCLPFRWRSGFLALASYVFYGWWRVDFVVLMLASTVLDYFCGAQIGRLNGLVDATPDGPEVSGWNRRRKRFVLLSICANLGLLGYFKYYNFGVETLNSLLVAAGGSALPYAEIILPVGISFYTFQSLSYSIDVYRREAPAVRRFIDFACYISLFPQLVAGPIVRYQTLAAELVTRSHTFEKIAKGAFLFQVGFVKKALFADTFAPTASAAFDLANPSFTDAWIGVLAYTFQIYFDFSGYSDMAIGLGLLFGFTFPINFNSPYKSISITDFWRRWHVSLSSWLRDYLYVPLGGNRKGPRRTYINLMLTMLLGGLWHGAAMTYVLWGAYQGAWLAFERLTGKKPLYARLPLPFQIAFTFVIAMGGWVLFRAKDAGQAVTFFKSMGGLGGANSSVLGSLGNVELLAFAVGAAVIWGLPNSQTLAEGKRGLARLVMAPLFVVAVAQMFVSEYSPFLYFQF
ncbi:MAG: MBOAT family protein, partial [Planctomycetota bacterium]